MRLYPTPTTQPLLTDRVLERVPRPHQPRLSASAQDLRESDAEVAISTHRWATRMRPNEALRVSNDYGDIRIKNSADSGMTYVGTVQKLGDEQRDPEFPANKFAGGLALSVEAPGDWQGRVDAGLRVPPGAPLVLRTDSGLIQVRTGTNDIDAESDDGPVQLRTDGKIVASTNKGTIRATFQSKDYAGAAGSLQTLSGNIEVWVRPDAALVISVSGELSNGLPDGVGNVRRGDDDKAIVELGEGGATLSVTSASGVIRLNAFPLPSISGTQNE